MNNNKPLPWRSVVQPVLIVFGSQFAPMIISRQN